METLTQEGLVTVLKKLSVRHGDGVLVHSAVQFLGRPSNGLATYLDAILEVVGQDGTIAVPTFNFGFCRGEIYDPEQTPSIDMGVFSEYVRQQPDSQRTRHPMQSLAILGKDAEMLATIDTRAAFDDGSVFDRMIQLDYKLLLLGASIQAASLIHWSEQRYEVPYRYWKIFSGSVVRNGDTIKADNAMFVRDLELDPQLDLLPVQQRLAEMGAWREEKLGYGTVACCSSKNFCSAADWLLKEDSWSLVANRPGSDERVETLRKEV